ncbi:phage portal protein [Alteriqipengyuania flavescens]|uniref:phage portal protein n=1 Tax=Alteriqipengyuania flavescens TaxID=3053610 RepID=UPI0025B51489|nr:phage portal protein [Alteriqipengyuania flavescens]WJY17495.1 phage portal protein [Alteriqipengyuania flavescens]WJY23438.1 phage portal protein [Alteriqipengyuania flavescens]
MIDRLAAFAGFERRADTSPLDPSWQALAPMTGYYSGLSARAAENLSTVLACTSSIATALAYVPARVYRWEGETRLEHALHPLSRLIRYGCNSAMTWCDTIEHLVADTLLTGNGLLEIERSGNGQVSGLIYHPWGMVTVQDLPSGRLRYDIGDGKGNTRRLIEGEAIHLRDRTNDGKIGVSRLSRSADTVTGVDLANRHARQFLANGANPSGVIEHPGTMTAEQRTALREQFQSRHEGAANSGRALILDGGLHWKVAQISPEDAELLETRRFGVEEIARLFQVPPPIIGDYTHNTFTNSETAGRWFATFCLAPWARKIEAEFSRSLFPSGSPYELELDLSGFLRGDPETRWNAHKIALEAGVLDADEVRQVEGWNPRTGTGARPDA